METRLVQIERFSLIQAAAALSVVALIGVALWQTYSTFVQKRPFLSASGTPSSVGELARTPYGGVNWQAPVPGAEANPSSEAYASEDKDGLSNIAENVVGALVGSYTALAETGSYTPAEGEKIAGDIAESLHASVSYKTYSTADLKTDADTSYERMLAYRASLREALEPLLGNPGYELGIFANYIESHDATYLEQLRTTAQNYREAVEKAAAVVVPVDAAPQHVGILNALSEFGATIERLSAHADDAFASAALLRTYQNSEARMMVSFNSLATYYTSKQP